MSTLKTGPLQDVLSTWTDPFPMPLIPGPDVYLELRMLGTIISAIAYGIVIVLSGNCFLLLLKKRGIYSNRMRLFLLIYVTVMLLLSTLAIIQSILGITLLIFQNVNLPLLVGSLPRFRWPSGEQMDSW
jgi:hypothetical protein